MMTLGVLLLGHGVAHAQALGWPYWASNGAGCVPGDPAIQADRYFITAGSVNYKAGGSGLVTLYCPVTTGSAPFFHPQLGTVLMGAACPENRYSLRLTYRDADGAGSAVSVAAQLIKLSKTNGAFLGAIAGAVVDSNSSAETGQTSLLSPFESAPFIAAYHYVRVDMNRAAGSGLVATFYGVSIECR